MATSYTNHRAYGLLYMEIISKHHNQIHKWATPGLIIPKLAYKLDRNHIGTILNIISGLAHPKQGGGNLAHPHLHYGKTGQAMAYNYGTNIRKGP